MKDCPPIRLATLESVPSWVNLASRIDRSACMELRASAVRRWTTFQRSTTASKASPRAMQRGKPSAKTHREAIGHTRISAYDIFQYQQHQRPRKLSGDYRTVKANAMRIARDKNGRPLPPRDKSHGLRNPMPGPDLSLHANPNRGVCRTKLLGLPGAPDWPRDLEVRDTKIEMLSARDCLNTNDRMRQLEFASAQDHASTPATTRRGTRAMVDHGIWEQTFTLERWRQHERLAQHFILCPTCGHKYVKLFLPLCTKEELRDALLAEQWLAMQFTHPLPQVRHPRSQIQNGFIRQLNERYGSLFQPRGFQCRKCLGVRYGIGGRHKTR